MAIQISIFARNNKEIKLRDTELIHDKIIIVHSRTASMHVEQAGDQYFHFIFFLTIYIDIRYYCSTRHYIDWQLHCAAN